MQRFDQYSAVCRMFTYGGGMFSSLAHDLRIDVNSFIVELGGPDHFIKARFDARSLNVSCAMDKGKERPGRLSALDRDIINKIMLNDILNSNIYPDITITSSSIEKEDSALQVKGPVVLHGRKRDITFTVKQPDKKLYVADVRLHLPDFGITLLSFLFGAVKIRPDILVHIELPVLDQFEYNHHV
jgi:hypothetical protein